MYFRAKKELILFLVESILGKAPVVKTDLFLSKLQK